MKIKKAVEFADSTALTLGLRPHYQKKHPGMLHFVDVVLKEVFDQGRDYKWIPPFHCPRCLHCKVWGHGFVDRIFDQFTAPLPIKRFRCNHCGCIICCRPNSHFGRIQASIATIKIFLRHRLIQGRWPTSAPHSRHRHWLRNLKRKILAHLGMVDPDGLLEGYERLLELGQIPISSSI